MTDITELAQSMKAAAHKAKQDDDLYFEGKITLSEYVIETKDYLDLSDNPNNILALVEALEKAQQLDEELCKLLPPGAEYMDPPDGGDVTPLEGVRRMVADYRQRIAELDAVLEREREKSRRVMSRIAELESRTVKLVDCDFGAVQHMSGGSTDYCHGFVDGTQNAILAITAAGIKVEAE